MPEEKKAFLRTQGPADGAGLCFIKRCCALTLVKSPSWHTGEVASGGSCCVGPLQRLVLLPAAQRAQLIGEPLFLVHCVQHRVLGATGRVGSSHSFHRAQFNENRKIKGQDRRKKAPAMLMCQLGN